MTQVTPSPMIPTNDEKKSELYGAEASVNRVPSVEEEAGTSDGDDALKLAGTHAHHFDEKYYLRLRRKIVSNLDWKTIHGRCD